MEVYLTISLAILAILVLVLLGDGLKKNDKIEQLECDKFSLNELIIFKQKEHQKHRNIRIERHVKELANIKEELESNTRIYDELFLSLLSSIYYDPNSDNIIDMEDLVLLGEL